jgi:predicted DNA-binding transcriptional regulator AlpA
MLTSEITNVDKLPNCAVLTSRQAAALLNISTTTLWTLGRDRIGPPRVKLTRGRYGYPLGEFRKWLAAREAA